MAKANTKHKSKQPKKTAHKTFHKHSAEEPVTPSQESVSQTVQPVGETAIPPVIQPDPEPEPEAAPSSPQPEPIEENVAPAPTTTPPPAADTTPSAVNDAPTTGDTNNTSVDTNNPSPTMTPEEQRRAEPQSTSPIIDQEEGKSKKPIIAIAIIVIILIAVASGYFLYSKKLKFTSQKPQQTAVTQTPSPQAIVQTINKADWSLEILNGSTKTGAASALAEKLTAKGYQIIKIGNNPENSATSQVFFSDSKKDQAGLFLEDIKDGLPNPTNAGSLKDSTASARIIIGEE